MMTGPICKPDVDAASAGNTDAFGFGAASSDLQGTQNMMLMLTMPWVAMMALGHEMVEESMRRAFGG